MEPAKIDYLNWQEQLRKLHLSLYDDGWVDDLEKIVPAMDGFCRDMNVVGNATEALAYANAFRKARRPEDRERYLRLVRRKIASLNEAIGMHVTARPR